MPVPFFTIAADGVDVTGNLMGAGLISMVITDGEGMRADTLQIEIDNVDASVIGPRTGVVLNPQGGYKDRMRDFGLFTVDSVVYTGWPQRISVQAKSVAAKSLAKQREPKSYPPDDYPTYGDILESIAGRLGLKLTMPEALRNLSNSFEAQVDENGMEFISRIAEKINATITPKAGQLVAVEKGAGKGASGGLLDRVMVAPKLNLLSYSVSRTDEPKHSEVEATYYDRAKNKREIVTQSTKTDGPKFLLRTPFQNKDEAERAAMAQARELERKQSEGTFEIDGDPFAQAEAWAQVTGVHPEVDGLWRIRTATHTFSAMGPYTTSLACGGTSGEDGDDAGSVQSGNQQAGAVGSGSGGGNTGGIVT